MYPGQRVVNLSAAFPHAATRSLPSMANLALQTGIASMDYIVHSAHRPAKFVLSLVNLARAQMNVLPIVVRLCFAKCQPIIRQLCTFDFECGIGSSVTRRFRTCQLPVGAGEFCSSLRSCEAGLLCDFATRKCKDLSVPDSAKI